MKNPLAPRETNGRYTFKRMCDACGKSVCEETRYTDYDVCDGSDGPGFFLCDRPACMAKRDALDVPARTSLYTARRAKNVVAAAKRATKYHAKFNDI